MVSYQGEVRGELKARLGKGNYCDEKTGKYKGIGDREGPDSC